MHCNQYYKMENLKKNFSKESIGDIITKLKEKSIDLPSWDVLLKDYEPTLHAIVSDKIRRKDKVRSDGTVEKASRIYIGLEQLLTRRMVEFMFAIPVRRVYHNVGGNDIRQQIAKAIEAIYKHVRIDSENIKRGNAYFASCEFFTLWYAVESPNQLYGFNSKFKLKCKTFSPMDGCRLYPLFDEYGDMKAMSFEYVKSDGDFDTIYFETFTADKHYKWKQSGKGWETVVDGENVSILKIPCVYMHRSIPIYHGLSYIREEIEYTLSRNSDVIAYNSAPIIKIAGGIQGEEQKGESKRVYRVENGGDVAYVSWTQAIEALKYQVETLTNLFWTQSQMPDISFAKMMSMGNIGFDARQTLLADAHLKVGDESGSWYEFFDREANVIKAFLKEMNTSWRNDIDAIEIESVITPFIQNDEKADIEKYITANGGKPIMSQIESIMYFGHSTNPEETLEQINKEEAESAQAKMNSLMEGAL